MSEINQDKLAQIIIELDDMIPREGASVKLETNPENSDNFITANRLGFLRLGVEMLKAGYMPPASEIPDVPPIGEVDLSYIFESDVELNSEDGQSPPQPFIPPLAQPPAGSTMDSASQITLFILLALLTLIAALIAYAMGFLGGH